METNYLGAVYCTYHALSYLKKSRGMIVAISSIQGKIAVPYHSGYVASKHAVQGFFDTLRSEIEGQGVDVLTVLPYWLKGTTLRNSAFGKDGMALGQESKKSKKVPTVVNNPKRYSKASILFDSLYNSIFVIAKAIVNAIIVNVIVIYKQG